MRSRPLKRVFRKFRTVLGPAPDFLDALSESPTDGGAGMPCRSAVDGGAAILRDVLRHVWRHIAHAAFGDERLGIEALVATDGDSFRAGQRLADHVERRLALGGAVGLGDP